MCCHRSVPVCESLTLCLFFSLCRWWAGKKQSANIIRVRMKVTHDCCYFLFYIRFLRILTLKVIVPLLAWDVIKFDSTLSLFHFCVRLANNDLLSLDPFSPTLAAGSSHSVSSSTGNTSFHLDSCGRVFPHDARFYISTASLNKMCTPIRDRCDSFLNLYFFDFSPRLVWRHLCLLVATANLKLQQTCAEQLLCREYNRRTSGLSV